MKHKCVGLDADWVTTADIAAMLGISYWGALGLAASGLFGEASVLGGRKFYRRGLAESGVARRRAQIAARGKTAPVAVA